MRDLMRELRETPDLGAAQRTALPVRIVGAVPPEAVQHARKAFADLGTTAVPPVWSLRVRLTRSWDPALAAPVLAQANAQVAGWMVRVQVDAPTAAQAVERLSARLRMRIKQVGGRCAAPWAHAEELDPRRWQEADVPASLPPHVHRPAYLRRITRHKSCTPVLSSVAEAAFDLELLDQKFHLFVERDSRRISVLRKFGATGYQLTQEHTGEQHRITTAGLNVALAAEPVPVMEVSKVINRLNRTGLPFVHFSDVEAGRSSVLYRRYDGHYGLISAVGSGLWHARS